MPAPVAEPTVVPAPVAESVATPLPPFEQLMADLPSRRTLREAGRRRGLFGRRPEDEPTAEPAPEAAPEPAGPVAPVTPAAGTEAAPAVAHLELAEPAAAGPDLVAPAAADPGVVEPAAEPAAEPVAPAHASEPAPAAAPLDAWRSTSRAQGGTALPLRTPSAERGAPVLTDVVEETPDTVEARSEWIASAVLYEEMSSLLRRGILPQAPAADDATTYQPRAVVTSDGAGLARRSRAAEGESPAERFTARIERDPEQLRSRLSAFQTATRQGRAGAEDEPAPDGETVPSAPDHRTAPGTH